MGELVSGDRPLCLCVLEQGAYDDGLLLFNENGELICDG